MFGILTIIDHCELNVVIVGCHFEIRDIGVRLVRFVRVLDDCGSHIFIGILLLNGKIVRDAREQNIVSLSSLYMNGVGV